MTEVDTEISATGAVAAATPARAAPTELAAPGLTARREGTRIEIGQYSYSL